MKKNNDTAERSIVVVDHDEYGVPSSIAKNIRDQFQPMLDKMVELENDFNRISAMDPEDDKTSPLAGELLKQYVKVRTGVDKIHKEQKAFYLAGGRFVDGWKNAHLMASNGKETKLKELKDYRANIERIRIENLHIQRASQVAPYLQAPDLSTNYGVFNNDVWEAYLEGKKKAYDELKKAEAEALAKEQELLRIERIRSSRMPHVWRLDDFITDFVEDWALLSDDEFNAIVSKAVKAKEEFDLKAKEMAVKALELEKKTAQLTLENVRLKERSEAQPVEKSKAIPDYSAEMPVREKLKAWVESMDLPVCPDYGNDVSIEIINKFGGFKSWAIKLIDQKL